MHPYVCGGGVTCVSFCQLKALSENPEQTAAQAMQATKHANIKVCYPVAHMHPLMCTSPALLTSVCTLCVVLPALLLCWWQKELAGVQEALKQLRPWAEQVAFADIELSKDDPATAVCYECHSKCSQSEAAARAAAAAAPAQLTTSASSSKPVTRKRLRKGTAQANRA